MKSFAEYYSKVTYKQLIDAMVYQMPWSMPDESLPEHQQVIDMIDDLICPEAGSETPRLIKPMFENYLTSEISSFSICNESFAEVTINATSKLVSSFYSSTTHQELAR